ncbi:MAG: tetratricopeptide repeat protein, partial [Bacteroidota bacterium]
ENESKPVIPLKRWYYMAASLVLLIVASAVWWQYYPNPGDEVFVSYYQPYPDVLTSRGDGGSLLNEGMVYYEQGEYPRAIDRFEDYLKDNNDDHVRFYLAQANMANEHYEEAAQLFEVLNNLDEFGLREASEWYLTLIYLKTGQREKAKSILQKIESSANHAYGTQARQVLNQIY